MLEFDPIEYIRMKTSSPTVKGKERPLAKISLINGKPVMEMRRFHVNDKELNEISVEEIKPRTYELNIQQLKEERARLENYLTDLSYIIFEAETL